MDKREHTDHPTSRATRDEGLSALGGIWKGPAIGLMDLDAFFASVEMLDHPEWRGKPLIVGGSPERRGVVSTASYEARKYGVHSAMPSWQAKRLCPQAIWTQGHYDRYRAVSAQVMAILDNETPFVERMSIDEAFFDITPNAHSPEDPVEVCRRIQRRVSDLGVTCSIGIGINKTVAKIASERQKPRGLTVVPPGTEAAFLAPLPVGVMSGVGSSTEKKLHEMGIRTLGQLARANPEVMANVFGVMGPRMITRAAGLERSRVRAASDPEPVKSVSNERTFSSDLTTREELLAAIGHVAELTGRRLRKKDLKGSCVTLKIRYSTLKVRTAQCQLDEPTDDEHVFGRAAEGLLDGLWKEGTAVRLVGVGMSSFGPHPHQLSLFSTLDGESGGCEGGTTKRGSAGTAKPGSDRATKLGSAGATTPESDDANRYKSSSGGAKLRSANLSEPARSIATEEKNVSLPPTSAAAYDDHKGSEQPPHEHGRPQREATHSSRSNPSARVSSAGLNHTQPKHDKAAATKHSEAHENAYASNVRASKTNQRNHKRDLRALSQATDAVRERFGNDAIAYGRDLRLKDKTSNTAPMNKADD